MIYIFVTAFLHLLKTRFSIHFIWMYFLHLNLLCVRRLNICETVDKVHDDGNMIYELIGMLLEGWCMYGKDCWLDNLLCATEKTTNKNKSSSSIILLLQKAIFSVEKLTKLFALDLVFLWKIVCHINYLKRCNMYNWIIVWNSA